MIATAFKLPDPGEGIHEAEIVEVCVSKGDKVREGDIVLSIETDKATVEVPSPMTGAIEDIRIQTGDIVQVGEVLITFTDEMRPEPETTQQPAAGSKADPQPREEAAPERPTSGDQAEPDEAVEPDEQSVAAKQDERIATETDDNSTARPVPASPATRRLARELGVCLRDVNGSGPGGRVAAEAIAGLPAAFDARAIPAMVYTDPQIAWCGLTEQEAQTQKLNVKVARFPWKASGRAVSMGLSEGFTKLIMDAESQQILGVGMVGAHAETLIAEGALAVEMGALAHDVALTVHPHPTLAETIGEAAQALLGSATHVFAQKN